MSTTYRLHLVLQDEHGRTNPAMPNDYYDFDHYPSQHELDESSRLFIEYFGFYSGTVLVPTIEELDD